MSSIYKALSKNKNAKQATGEEKSKHINRQRLLIISSRGVTYRYRHFINDLHSLMPHSKKQAKIGSKKNLYELNEVAEMYNCNNIAYFETRKHQDLYMWLAKAPNGPSMKFFVQNLSTLEELNFNGNCLKGSRPILSFDKTFEDTINMKLTKEMLIQTFGVPPTSRRIKPFIDHVMTFSIVDGKIWIRNYQINEQVLGSELQNNDLDEKLTNDDIQLVEIGPRCVLTPIVILEGAFCGPKIYENKQFVSPNVVRAQVRQQQALLAKGRQEAAIERKIKKRDNIISVDPLSNEALFNKKK